MIALVVSACLIDQPSRCRDVTLNFEGESVTAQQCENNGQLALAQWAGEHPNWVIQKWSCALAGQVAKL